MTLRSRPAAAARCHTPIPLQHCLLIRANTARYGVEPTIAIGSASQNRTDAIRVIFGKRIRPASRLATAARRV